MKLFKEIREKIRSLNHDVEYQDGRIRDAWEHITELETFSRNLILAIEKLNYGSTVEEAAKFEIHTNNGITRDFIKYMALLNGMNGKKKK